MPKKSLLEEVADWEGFVDNSYDPYAHILETPSVSLNCTFGNTWGLPDGYSLALWGPEKSGKSLISNLFTVMTHQSDPEAVVVKFNTEMRERVQFNAGIRARWGVDNDRYLPFEVNAPALIFDRIEQQLPTLIEKGHKIRLVIIDSIQGIQGRRDANADSINVQQIGDHAKTLQDGLKRILPVQRKYNIGLILVCQARAEMDKLEQDRGNKIKMAAPFAVRHHCEYFMLVERCFNKDDQKDLLGNEFRDETIKADYVSSKAKGEQTGHKIKVTMKDSSCGPKGRVGQFTLDYSKGLINPHEEIYELGKARGVIEHASGSKTFSFGDRKWTGGEPSILQALRDDTDLQRDVVRELKRRDMAGFYKQQDAVDEAANAESILEK